MTERTPTIRDKASTSSGRSACDARRSARQLDTLRGKAFRLRPLDKRPEKSAFDVILSRPAEVEQAYPCEKELIVNSRGGALNICRTPSASFGKQA